MNLILQVFYSVFSGLLLTLGIPNEFFLLGNPFFAFISIIPFYLAIKYAKNYRQAFLLGFIQSVTTHLTSSFWLAYFKNFAIFTLGASALGTAVIAGSIAIFMYVPFSRKEIPGLYSYAIKKPFHEDSAFRIVYFAALYTVYEWVKSSGFLGYPWGTISSAMYKWHSFTQLAAITGTYGLTFLTVFFDSIIAEGTENYYLSCKWQGISAHIEDRLPFFDSTINAAKVFTLLFTITLIWGNYEYNKPRTPVKSITTIMVQQNFNPWDQDTDNITVSTSMELSQEKIDELRKLNKEPQLIVWSEGSLQAAFPKAYDYYSWQPDPEPLISFLKRNRIPFITGGVVNKKTDDFNRYYNVNLAFDSDAHLRGYYGKLHLVPFAEHIPGIENPIIKKIFKKVVGISAGWTPGGQLTYFDIPCSYTGADFYPTLKDIDISMPYYTAQEQEDMAKVRISTPVCFDDSFTDVMRPMFLNGAELFVNLTDDSWSLKKSSEFQHFCIASYRAIEYRTTLIRSTNAGYSVVVSPSGAILADQPLFEESSLAYDVPIYAREMTPYARFGNWLPYSCIVLFVIVCILMVCTFVTDDYIPSERKKPIMLKKKKKNKKDKKKK